MINLEKVFVPIDHFSLMNLFISISIANPGNVQWFCFSIRIALKVIAKHNIFSSVEGSDDMIITGCPFFPSLFRVANRFTLFRMIKIEDEGSWHSDGVLLFLGIHVICFLINIFTF